MLYLNQVLETLMVLQKKSRNNFFKDWFNDAEAEYRNNNRFLALPYDAREGIFEGTSPAFKDTLIDCWFTTLFNILVWTYSKNLSCEETLKWDGFRTKNKLVVINCFKCNQNRIHTRVVDRLVAINFYSEHWHIKAENSLLSDFAYEDKSVQSLLAMQWRSNFYSEFKKNNVSISEDTLANQVCPKCGICSRNDTFNHHAYSIEKNDNDFWELKFIRKNDSSWIF